MRRIRRLRSRVAGGFAAALLCALLAAGAPAGAYTPVVGEGDGLDAPPLVDASGRALELRRGVFVVSFIYTRCADPAMCPLVTAKFGRMARLLEGTSVRLVEVTLDPAYDTPAVLRRYAAAVGAVGTAGRRWSFATGAPAALDAFAERAGIAADRPRPGVILHTEALLIVRDAVVERAIPGNEWSAAEIAAEARSVAELPADPLQRLALRAFGGLARLCGGAPGARGVTPGTTLALLLAALAAAGLLARRALRGILGGR